MSGTSYTRKGAGARNQSKIDLKLSHYEEVRAVTLWTYRCRDNIVRTRCGHHILRDGPAAILHDRAVIRREPNQPAFRCYECYMSGQVAKFVLEENRDARD